MQSRKRTWLSRPLRLVGITVLALGVFSMTLWVRAQSDQPAPSSETPEIATVEATSTPAGDEVLEVSAAATSVCFQNGTAGYSGATDTYIDRSNADTAYGSNTMLRVSNNGGANTLVRFDLSSIPQDAEIRSATLQLYGFTTSSTSLIQLSAYQVYRTWNEDEATWNLAQSGYWWYNPGCGLIGADRAGVATDQIQFNQVNTWATFDLTPLVQLWVGDRTRNYGVFIGGSADQNSVYSFWSSEASTALLRPKLCVNYDLPADREGQIMGIVWHDRNSNGVRESNEPPLAKATIELWRGQQKLNTYVTTETGIYSFIGLQPDNYAVTEINPPGYHSTTSDHSTVTVQAGSATRVDFGDRIGTAAYSIFKPLMHHRYGVRPTATPTSTRTPTVTHTPTRTPTATPTATATLEPDRWIAGTGLPGSQVNALWPFNNVCDKVYAGLDSVGVYITTNSGANWSHRGLDGSVLSLAAMPWNDSNVYAATWGFGVQHSIDGGISWTATNTGLGDNLYLYAVELDAENSTLYVGTGSAGVYKSTNSGNSWQPVNSGLADQNIRCLAIDPQTGHSVAYAGTLTGLYKTTNGGALWEKIGPADVRIRDVGIDPLNHNIIYVATDNGVYRSPDAGSTWPENTHQIIGARVNAIAFDKSSTTVVYAGREDHGVYRTLNSGFTWEAMNTGLPTGTSVRSLVSTSGAGGCTSLYAGTRERGIWGWH